MAGPIIGAIKRRWPRIGGLAERAWDAAFDKGGDITLPPTAEVTHTNPETGSVVVETTPAITVSRPKGFLRSRTVWAGIVLIGFQFAAAAGLDLGDGVQISKMVLDGNEIFSIINAAVMGYFRIKATNLTRG